MSKNIEIALKNNVTTLEKLIITEKEPLNETLSKNGAKDGTKHEPTFARLAQQCLHETEIMTRLEKWCA